MIAERFRRVLELQNEDRHHKPFTVVRLAQIMGLHTAGELERVFTGAEEPSFRLIEHFCDSFGVNKEWLLEGEGHPFFSPYIRACEPLGYLEDIRRLRPAVVYFILSRSDVGEAFLVLKHADWKFTILNLTLHVSDHVGDGGQRLLVSLCHLINRLKAEGVRCGGRTLDPQAFSALQMGDIFPGRVIDAAMCDDHWWDDFTDIHHENAGAANYEQLHGKPFIKAQEIVRWKLGNFGSVNG